MPTLSVNGLNGWISGPALVGSLSLIYVWSGCFYGSSFSPSPSHLFPVSVARAYPLSFVDVFVHPCLSFSPRALIHVARPIEKRVVVPSERFLTARVRETGIYIWCAR